MPPSLAWVLLILLALVFATPPLRRVGRMLDRFISALQRIPLGLEALVFLVAALLGAMPMLFDAVPPPSTHDEFAYLLAAETFAQGRLTNLPHPLWEHFETFHQIMHPTYTSKFPPGQGLALAGGLLLGRPIIGAWGLVALACAGICWMLRGWIPARWALIGALVAAAHPTIFWWGQIYWGGGVGLLGGALLGGTVGRALRRPAPRWGVVAGIGMGILALARPFEGALVSLILLAIVLGESFRRRQPRRLLLRFIVPAGVALAPFGAWMMYYNWRVTGEALTMPYVVHARQYMMSPLLWFQPAPSRPNYRHPKLEQFYELHEYQEYAKQRGARNFVRGMGEKLSDIASNVLAPSTLLIPLVVALVPLPMRLRPRRWRRRGAVGGAAIAGVLVCLAFVALHLLLTPWFRPQYLAPMAGFFFLVVAIGLGRLARVRFGAAVVTALVVLQFITVAGLIKQMIENPRPTGLARQQLVERLLATPGDDLVLVQYGPGPQYMFEWVFNAANIDAAPIVFARPIDEAGLRRLLDYYPARRAWRLHVDGPHMSFDELPR